jgi:hypothetical protein
MRDYTLHTQKNGSGSKVNKTFISHPSRAKRILSAAGTVQVSHALPAVRFSCLLFISSTHLLRRYVNEGRCVYEWS